MQEQKNLISLVSGAEEISNTFKKDHICQPDITSQQRCLFCIKCGVHMPQWQGKIFNDPNESFLRSNKFIIDLLPGCAGDLVLSQMIEKQSTNRYYNVSAPNIQHRESLIAWMRKICQNLQYSLNTFYNSVAYLDAIFSLYIVKECQIKLVGYICVFISAKLEEDDCKIPTIEQTTRMFKNEYGQAEIINCEKFVCRILSYNLNLKTPFNFLMFFCSKGFIQIKELKEGPGIKCFEKQIEMVEKLALFLADITARYYDFYQFTSIAIAAAILACSRECHGMQPWNTHLQRLTYVSCDSLSDCRDLIYKFFELNHKEQFYEYFPNKKMSIIKISSQKTFDPLSEVSTNDDLGSPNPPNNISDKPPISKFLQNNENNDLYLNSENSNVNINYKVRKD